MDALIVRDPAAATHLATAAPPPASPPSPCAATETSLTGSRAGPPHGQPPSHTSYPVLPLPPPVAEQSEDRTSEEIERRNTQLILQGVEIDLICLVVRIFDNDGAHTFPRCLGKGRSV